MKSAGGRFLAKRYRRPVLLGSVQEAARPATQTLGNEGPPLERWRSPWEGDKLPPVEALEELLAALTKREALAEEHALLVANARSLALAVTTDSGNSSLWREFRQVEAELRGLFPQPDEFARIVEWLRSDMTEIQREEQER